MHRELTLDVGLRCGSAFEGTGPADCRRTYQAGSDFNLGTTVRGTAGAGGGNRGGGAVSVADALPALRSPQPSARP